MPILTMVKTRMSRRQSAGLLASGTLSSAIISSKHLLDHAAGALVFFNGTTDDDDVCFVWHGIASLQHATSLLAYRCTRNRRYEVSEDEHPQLLSGEGILYNKVPRKEKKCNKTNSNERLAGRDLSRCLYASVEILLNQAASLPPFWNGLQGDRKVALSN
jgi:hypothetical protein